VVRNSPEQVWRMSTRQDFPLRLVTGATRRKVRKASSSRLQMAWCAGGVALIANGVDWQGCRQSLALERANRKSRSSSREFRVKLTERALHGVDCLVVLDHSGLCAAVRETFTNAYFQWCSADHLRNTLDHLPRKADEK
jgi:transposase-like protein